MLDAIARWLLRRAVDMAAQSESTLIELLPKSSMEPLTDSEELRLRVAILQRQLASEVMKQAFRIATSAPLELIESPKFWKGSYKKWLLPYD